MSSVVMDVAAQIAAGPSGRRLLVAIDGVDASGKTTFAVRLATALRSLSRCCQVVHADDFMHPPAVRHRRGRSSPVGYFLDSYDYESLTRHVLDPLGRGGDGWFRSGTVDRAREVVAERPAQYADPDSVTVVEGLFLHRDELVERWDFSVFLDVDTATALARKARRDGVDLAPGSPLRRRYVEGQRIYLERCRPRQRATWVVDNGGDQISAGRGRPARPAP